MHDRRRIVLPVRLLPPTPTNDLTGRPSLALLDTGSTTSGIAARVAREMGLIRRGKRPMGSAQGEGQIERYLFRIGLDADPQPGEGPRFPYIFQETEGFELVDSFRLDALIGMDVLHQCSFSMDRQRRCRLEFG